MTTKPPVKKKRQIVQIDEDTANRLRALSEVSMIPIARLVRQACETYIEKMKKPVADFREAKRKALARQ